MSQLAERLGHATVSITLDTYSHAIPALREAAAALIAGLVFAAESRRRWDTGGRQPKVK